MKQQPLVSVITPSFNQAHFLENTLLSVLEQDYPGIEYIVLDGGSTDESVNIIKKYADRITYWQSEADSGQVDAINKGFRMAKGEILTFLNSDDILLEGAVSAIVEMYLEHPDASAWVGGGHSIAQDGYIIQTRRPKKVSHAELADWLNNWINQPSCFVSARAAQAVGYLNPKYENAFDFDFWMKLSKIGEFIPTNRIFSASTVHPDAKTQKFKLRMYAETYTIQKEYGFEDYAKALEPYLDIAENQNTTGTIARLLYETNKLKRFAPDNYVRMPKRPKD